MIDFILEVAEGRTWSDKLVSISFLLSMMIVGWKLAG
jgi:hypothetical protein